MKLHILLVAITFSFCGCGEDDGGSGIVSPSNLDVTVEISDLNNGQVDFSAAALNTNFYQFDFGVNEGFVQDDDGIISYQYQSSGSYNVIVRAHSTQSDFIALTEAVEVEIAAEPLPGGYETPLSYDDYNLSWNDEFEGTSLSSDWTFEIGTGDNGWGNNELQYYLEKNTSVTNGFLIIEAKKESVSGRDYTSSRIITQGKQEFQYGRIDIRALLPEGQGIWPALWMLGANFQTVGWPKCGEIDIMEMVGGVTGDKTVYGTLHWDNNNSGACTCDKSGYVLPSGKFSDEFHVFSLVWDESTIEWMVDDEVFNAIDITPADLEEFRNKFFLIFNVAVGGDWPGSPDSSTRFPQKMVVDYVRVFQK